MIEFNKKDEINLRKKQKTISKFIINIAKEIFYSIEKKLKNRKIDIKNIIISCNIIDENNIETKLENKNLDIKYKRKQVELLLFLSENNLLQGVFKLISEYIQKRRREDKIILKIYDDFLFDSYYSIFKNYNYFCIDYCHILDVQYIKLYVERNKDLLQDEDKIKIFNLISNPFNCLQLISVFNRLWDGKLIKINMEDGCFQPFKIGNSEEKENLNNFLRFIKVQKKDGKSNTNYSIFNKKSKIWKNNVKVFLNIRSKIVECKDKKWYEKINLLEEIKKLD